MPISLTVESLSDCACDSTKAFLIYVEYILKKLDLVYKNKESSNKTNNI